MVQRQVVSSENETLMARSVSSLSPSDLSFSPFGQTKMESHLAVWPTSPLFFTEAGCESLIPFNQRRSRLKSF